jgi:hypothetical protein
MPSEPIVRDKYILYKNPKNFSLIENTVTIATVLKNLRKFIPPKVSVVISLFVELYKYNKGMKNFFYRVVEGDTVFLLSEKRMRVCRGKNSVPRDGLLSPRRESRQSAA